MTYLSVLVAEFAQKISQIHEQFASQIQSVVETFKKKNQELKKERWVYKMMWIYTVHRRHVCIYF